MVPIENLPELMSHHSTPTPNTIQSYSRSIASGDSVAIGTAVWQAAPTDMLLSGRTGTPTYSGPVSGKEEAEEEQQD